jgi:hypothetical protein
MAGCIRIERLENGFTVEMDDPAIVKANNKRDNSKGPYIPYRDPSRKFTFQDKKAVMAFITKNIDKIIPEPKDDFTSSFNIASKESD